MAVTRSKIALCQTGMRGVPYPRGPQRSPLPFRTFESVSSFKCNGYLYYYIVTLSLTLTFVINRPEYTDQLLLQLFAGKR